MRPRPFVLAAATAIAMSTPFVATATAAPATAKVTTYSIKNSGQTVSMVRGTVFKVHLHYCGDCGDSWSFAQKPAPRIVAFEGRKNTSTAKPPAVGGENDGYWTFKATGPGTTKIRLAEHSAQKSGQVTKRFTLTVKVAAPLANGG